MLEVRALSAGYHGNDVVRDVDFRVDEGEVVMIIGANGAGKTTLFRAICGLLPTSKGNVHFDEQDINDLPAEKIAQLGISFVPAERRLFPGMTVQENLTLGAYPHRPDSETMQSILDLFPRLAERLRQRAGTMSGGEQLAPVLAQAAYEALGVLRERGMTVLVAEQQVPLAMSISDRGYVLENGLIKLQGTTKELAENPGIRAAYLGMS